MLFPDFFAILLIVRVVDYSGGDYMLSKEMENELITNLRNLFQASLKEIILYGSVARGEAQDESDIDIAIIITTEIDGKIRDAFFEMLSAMDLKYDRVFSVIDIDKNMFDKWQNILPFYKNIKNDGVVLWKAA